MDLRPIRKININLLVGLLVSLVNNLNLQMESIKFKLNNNLLNNNQKKLQSHWNEIPSSSLCHNSHTQHKTDQTLTKYDVINTRYIHQNPLLAMNGALNLLLLLFYYYYYAGHWANSPNLLHSSNSCTNASFRSEWDFYWKLKIEMKKKNLQKISNNNKLIILLWIDSWIGAV